MNIIYQHQSDIHIKSPDISVTPLHQVTPAKPISRLPARADNKLGNPSSHGATTTLSAQSNTSSPKPPLQTRSYFSRHRREINHKQQVDSTGVGAAALVQEDAGIKVSSANASRLASYTSSLGKLFANHGSTLALGVSAYLRLAKSADSTREEGIDLQKLKPPPTALNSTDIASCVHRLLNANNSGGTDINIKEMRFFFKQLLTGPMAEAVKRTLSLNESSGTLIDKLMTRSDRENILLNLLSGLVDQTLLTTIPLEPLILDQTAEWVRIKQPTLATLGQDTWTRAISGSVLANYADIPDNLTLAVGKLVNSKLQQLFPVARQLERLAPPVLSLPLSSELATLYNIGATRLPVDSHEKYWSSAFALAGADNIRYYPDANSLIADQMLVQQVGHWNIEHGSQLSQLARLKYAYARLHRYVDPQIQVALEYAQTIASITQFIQQNKKQPLVDSENEHRLADLLSKKTAAEKNLYRMALDSLLPVERTQLVQAIKQHRVTVSRYYLTAKDSGNEKLTMTSLAYRIKVPPAADSANTVPREYVISIANAASTFPPVQLLRMPAADTAQTQGMTEKALMAADMRNSYRLQESAELDSFKEIENERDFIKILVAEDAVNFKLSSRQRGKEAAEVAPDHVTLTDFLKELANQLIAMTPLVCLSAAWDIVKIGQTSGTGQQQSEIAALGADSTACFLSLLAGVKEEVTAGKIVAGGVKLLVYNRLKKWLAGKDEESEAQLASNVGSAARIKLEIDKLYQNAREIQPKPRLGFIKSNKTILQRAEFQGRNPLGISLALPGQLVLEFEPGLEHGKQTKYASRVDENKFTQITDAEGIYHQDMVYGNIVVNAINKYINNEMSYNQLANAVALQKQFNFIKDYAEPLPEITPAGFPSRVKPDAELPDHAFFSPQRRIVYSGGYAYLPVGDSYFRCDIISEINSRYYRVLGKNDTPSDLRFVINESKSGDYFVAVDNVSELVSAEASQILVQRSEGPEKFVKNMGNMIYQGLYAIGNSNNDYMLAMKKPKDEKIHYRKLGSDRKFWPLPDNGSKVFMQQSKRYGHYDGIPLSQIDKRDIQVNAINQELFRLDRRLVTENFSREIINAYLQLEGKDEPEILSYFAESQLEKGGWSDRDFSVLSGVPMSHGQISVIRRMAGRIINGRIFNLDESSLLLAGNFFRSIARKLSQSTANSEIYRKFHQSQSNHESTKIPQYIAELDWLGSLAESAHRLVIKRQTFTFLELKRAEMIENKKLTELESGRAFYHRVLKLTEIFDPSIEKTDEWTYKKVNRQNKSAALRYAGLMSEFKLADISITHILRKIGKTWPDDDPRWQYFKNYFNLDPNLLAPEEKSKFSKIIATVYDKFDSGSVHKNITLIKPWHDRQGRFFIEPDNPLAKLGVVMDAEAFTYVKGSKAGEVYYNLAIDPLSSIAHKRGLLMHELSHQAGASGASEVYYGFFGGGMRSDDPGKIATNFKDIQQSPYAAYGMASNDSAFAINLQKRISFIKSKQSNNPGSFWHSSEAMAYQNIDFISHADLPLRNLTILKFFKELYKPGNENERWQLLVGPHPDALVGFIYHLDQKLSAPSPARDKRTPLATEAVLAQQLLAEVVQQSINPPVAGTQTNEESGLGAENAADAIYVMTYFSPPESSPVTAVDV